MISPQTGRDFWPVHLAKPSRAYTFYRSDQSGQSDVWRILDEQMDMISISLKCHHLHAKIGTYGRDRIPKQGLDPICCDGSAAIFRR